MSRKTVAVDKLKEMANNILADSYYEQNSRDCLIVFVDKILMDTGNYKGFRYLTKNEVPVGQFPGINTPIEDLSYEERFKHTDPTRLCYK